MVSPSEAKLCPRHDLNSGSWLLKANGKQSESGLKGSGMGKRNRGLLKDAARARAKNLARAREHEARPPSPDRDVTMLEP